MSDAKADRRVRWIARTGAFLIRLLASTWRVRYVARSVIDDHREARQPIIYLIWHGQLLPLLWTHRNRDIAVIISEHRDGEIIARVAESLGFRTVRGSTSRGAARALLEASRAIEEGHDVAITVDGPRGPAGSVAPGALVISQRAGAPMVPTGATATRSWRLRSWDRFMIPKPFARVVVSYGSAIRLEATSAREAADRVDHVRVALEQVAGAAVSSG